MANYNLTSQNISSSFQQLLQKNDDNGFLVNGTGSIVQGLTISGSVSASQFFGDGSGLSGVSTNTGSLLLTASFDNGSRNLTFTKGDSSTFAVNIPDDSGSVIPPGTVSGSSQIDYPQISNIPAGIISGSEQLTGSFVTLNTQQSITSPKNFNPSPDGSVGISMQNATRIAFGGSTNRISSPDSNTLNIETINNAPVLGSPNTLNVISGVSGSTIGNGSVINIETRGKQEGQSVNVRTDIFYVYGNNLISGALNVLNSLTHSLQEGFVLVGNSSGITTAVSTGSFGGGGTGNGFPFSGSAVITGSLLVSETVKSQVYMNPQTLDGFTIPTGNNAMLVGPVAISGSIVVEGNSNLVVLSQITASALPSGLLSSSVTDFTTYSASVDSRINNISVDTSSLATTGSNTFIGNQTITGSLRVSSSVDRVVIQAPAFSNLDPNDLGGVVISGSFSVEGDTRLSAAVRFSQCDVNKLVAGQGGLINGIAIVSDVLIYNDGNINNARSLGVSGSAHVSQSISVGEAVRLSQSDPLPSGTTGSLAVSGSNLYFFDGTWRQVSLI